MSESLVGHLTEIVSVLFDGWQWLLIAQLLPLLMAGLILLLKRSKALSVIAILLALLCMVPLVMLYGQLDVQVGIQFRGQYSIFGLTAYHAAIDGLSLLFMLLSGFLTVLMVLHTHSREVEDKHQIYALLFLVEALLLALFSTLNLMIFIIYSTLQIAAIGLLTWKWSNSPEKELALKRFFQFMAMSLLMLLVGTLLLGWNHAQVVGYWSFDLTKLRALSDSMQMNPALQTLVFYSLFYSFAIRSPLFPFHGWLALTAQHGNVVLAPTILLGIKIGIYGLLRFVLPLLPEASAQWSSYVVSFAMVGVFYAAILAIVQNNIRRLTAYAVVSHTGLIVVGIFSMHSLAIQGSIILAVTYGLAASAILVTLGQIERRTHTTRMTKLGGLFDQIPVTGLGFGFASLAVIGMPGTPGFDALHLVLEAGVIRFGAIVTIAMALGNLVVAGFLLRAFQRTFLLAPNEDHHFVGMQGNTVLEYISVGLIVLVIVSVGFFSQPWLRLIAFPANELGDLLGGGTH